MLKKEKTNSNEYFEKLICTQEKETKCKLVQKFVVIIADMQTKSANSLDIYI